VILSSDSMNMKTYTCSHKNLRSYAVLVENLGIQLGQDHVDLCVLVLLQR
jgi:hypothetical protein